MARPLSPEELALRKRLMDEFPCYAPGCLKIRTKTGDVLPLRLNRAQRYLHDRLEGQRAATGKVRALALKGRQQGISTYIGGRFYWKTTHGRGLRCFILTHEQDATNNLFSMVERYHDHCPAIVKPSTGASNAWFASGLRPWCRRCRPHSRFPSYRTNGLDDAGKMRRRIRPERHF
jgi:hypothetical protein